MKSFMFGMALSRLEDVVGEDNIFTRESDKLTYGVNYFWVSRMWTDRGQKPSKAGFVVWPDSAEEVSKILKMADYYKISVHTWGGGSGPQGGALLMADGIIMDLKWMNRLIEIDEESRTITTETRMIFQQLKQYTNERGYSCVHTPFCLIYGTVSRALAYRGADIMSTEYGRIDDQCLSMEMVLLNGDIINTLPVPKHVAGPDLNQILVGSKGTPRMMTRARFKLFEQPEPRRLRAFMFPSMKDGIAAGWDVMQKVGPSILHLFDEAETVSIIRKTIGMKEKGSSTDLALKGTKRIIDIGMEVVIDVYRQHGGRDMGAGYRRERYENRIIFFYPGNVTDVPQVLGTADTMSDFARIKEVYWAMRRAIKSNFPDVRFIAHRSHQYEWGIMIYDRFICDNPPEDPEEVIRLHNRI